ncbi:unnamed protein product [Aureobasidium vineae]|uniref:Uncharacterized protein n=1 Tax=Aureobasidium vineae TaxID=2773715 RepID=A0A9N8JFT9_9PEZI|nr:unnamed protein product [Aureobasidium vineae]
MPSEKELKIWNTITYTKPGCEDKLEDTDGTVEPQYTPLAIKGRPELPYYDTTTNSVVSMTEHILRMNPNTPAKAPRAPKPTAVSSKKKGKPTKATLKREAEDEGSLLAVSTEKKPRSAKKVVKAEEGDDAAYNNKAPRKTQNTPATSKRKAPTKPASKATPAKPKGVTKSKKTPSTMVKKMSTMMVDSPGAADLEAAATPSKKVPAPKRKAKATNVPEAEEPAAMEAAPVAVNEVEKSAAQSYGRVNTDGPTMPVQSFESMRTGLPADRFQMRGYQPSQSFDSQSTVSTAPSQSLPTMQTQCMPNGYHNSMQNGFPGNNYGQQVMQGYALSFAHGHNLSKMSPEKLANMNEEQMRQYIFGLHRQQASAAIPIQQQQQQYTNPNINGHNSGPHGLGIMNAPALMPREPFHPDTEMGDYSFSSGPASTMPSQQQFFSVGDADMQVMANDTKPNMQQYVGDFADLPDFDSNGIFGEGSLH